MPARLSSALDFIKRSDDLLSEAFSSSTCIGENMFFFFHNIMKSSGLAINVKNNMIKVNAIMLMKYKGKASSSLSLSLSALSLSHIRNVLLADVKLSL